MKTTESQIKNENPSQSAPPILTVLCRVIDNFGDIGVVYRLSRALSELNTAANGAYFSHLRLVVDDLASFARLAPGIDTTANKQSYNGWTIYRWDCGAKVGASTAAQTATNTYTANNGTHRAETAHAAHVPSAITRAPNTADDTAVNDVAVCDFSQKPSTVIIESFACGKPLWLENLIFSPNNGARTLLINLEYLTAEPYAEEFHLQKALTRAACVQKYFFMPGFSAKTGALILDNAFCKSLATRNTSAHSEAAIGARLRDKITPLQSHKSSSVAQAPTRTHTAQVAAETTSPARAPRPTQATAETTNPVPPAPQPLPFTVTVFTYELNFSPIVRALTQFQAKRRESVPDFALTVNLANGRGAESFCTAHQKQSAPFALTELSFMAQSEWDAVLCNSDFLFVRGEDSLSRAALIGVPFVWHAYPQSENYQLVKVRALLDVMRPHFLPDDFEVLSRYWLFFNGETDLCVTDLSEIPPRAPRLSKSNSRTTDDSDSGALTLHNSNKDSNQNAPHLSDSKSDALQGSNSDSISAQDSNLRTFPTLNSTKSSNSRTPTIHNFNTSSISAAQIQVNLNTLDLPNFTSNSNPHIFPLTNSIKSSNSHAQTQGTSSTVDSLAPPDSASLLFNLLCRYDSLHKSFDSFAKMLRKNGNLALHLLTFLVQMR